MLCHICRHHRGHRPKNPIGSATQRLMRPHKIINSHRNGKFGAEPRKSTSKSRCLARKMCIPQAPIEIRPFHICRVDCPTRRVRQASLHIGLAPVDHPSLDLHHSSLLARFMHGGIDQVWIDHSHRIRGTTAFARRQRRDLLVEYFFQHCPIMRQFIRDE